MELTKAHFDKQLASHTARIEKKIEKEVEGLATMVAEGFADLEKRLDVKDRVDTLEKKMSKVETAPQRPVIAFDLVLDPEEVSAGAPPFGDCGITDLTWPAERLS